ncbi:SRPBCC family protein [Kitasatospora sp. RB6PN24]|nr:SRPBCC family protein [Kitasatospora humi]
MEQIEVGVPVRVAYNQWTQFQDFPKYTKRLEHVEQESDEKLSWKAGIFLSHRTWESTIIKQVPDEMIVWQSKGEKGSVDGTVTFHEVTPTLTKILLVLEYKPQGLFERTGNLWRAQGRRVRLELKHFRRHVMTQVILDPESVEGWRGEIRDGEVVRSHEDALEEEKNEGDEESQEPEDEYDEEEPEGEEDEEEPEDEEDEEEEEEEEGPEDEYDEEEPEGEEDYEGEEPEDEYEGGDEEPEDDEDDYEGGDEEPEDEYEESGDDDEYEEDEDEDEEEDEGDEEPARRRGSRRALARNR